MILGSPPDDARAPGVRHALHNFGELDDEFAEVRLVDGDPGLARIGKFTLDTFDPDRSRDLFPTRAATKNAAICLRKLHRFDEALEDARRERALAYLLLIPSLLIFGGSGNSDLARPFREKSALIPLLRLLIFRRWSAVTESWTSSLGRLEMISLNLLPKTTTDPFFSMDAASSIMTDVSISGDIDDLYRAYGIDAQSIFEAAADPMASGSTSHGSQTT